MCRCLGASTPLYGHVMVPVLFITGISIFRSLLTAMQMCLRLFSKYLLPCTHATLSISWDACPGRCSPCPPLPVPALIVPCRALTLGSIPRRRGRRGLLPDFSQRKLTIKSACALSPSPPWYSLGLQWPFLLLLPISLLWKSFYTHTYTHTHTHMHTNMHIQAHTYACKHIHIYTCTLIHVHTHVKVWNH